MVRALGWKPKGRRFKSYLKQVLDLEQYKSYIQMLEQFFSIVEHDTSSILYYTRVFDNFILEGISDFFQKSVIDVSLSFSTIGSFNSLFYHTHSKSFFYFFYMNFYLEFLNDVNQFVLYFDNKYFDNSLLFIMFDLFLVTTNIDYVNFYFNEYFLIFQKNEIFSFVTVSYSVFFEYVYSLDIFIILLEIFAVLFVFLYFFSNMKNFFITTKFYDNIINFFKQNNLSFLEITITCTLYFSFIFFDIFLSFCEDDAFDVFFYLIFIFIIITFFFLSIAIDIQYFFTMSNTSNGDITIRMLFFDILNNFLSILRVFLCWIRYIFYDIQVEAIDFTFHYTDYSNEMYLNYLFKENYESNETSKNFDISFFFLIKSFFWYIIVFFFDISIIIIQIILSVFKLIIAFYLIWLIVDLFILKVLCLKESNKLRKNL